MRFDFKKIIFVQGIIFLTVLFFSPITFATTASVDTVKEGLETSASAAGITPQSGAADLPTMIGRAINYLFGAVGVIFLTIILVGGYLWMTAGGSEEKIKKAKEFIINGINGMIVIFLAYALAYIMLSALNQATTG